MLAGCATSEKSSVPFDNVLSFEGGGDNHHWDLFTFAAGLLRCMYVANGIGLFFLPPPCPSPVALWSWQLNLNGCAWCWVVHRTISRLKCDCFNTLIHLSLAFRMLQKSPNYFSALDPNWLERSRGCSTPLLTKRKKKTLVLTGKISHFISWKWWIIMILKKQKGLV